MLGEILGHKLIVYPKLQLSDHLRENSKCFFLPLDNCIQTRNQILIVFSDILLGLYPERGRGHESSVEEENLEGETD